MRRPLSMVRVAVIALAIMVLTGYGKGELEYHPKRDRVIPDHTAADLLDAAAWIVTRERVKGN